MNILMGGGTGFVGRMLIPALLAANHRVTVVGRNKDNIIRQFHGSVDACEWRELASLDAAHFDVIINLTGSGIAAKKWSPSVKKELVSSRIDAVRALIAWCKQSTGTKPRFYSASAIGFYGLQTAVPAINQYYTEASFVGVKADNSFCCDLVNQWEAAAREAEIDHIPLTIMRFGVVLHRGEGMLKELEMPAKFGMSAVLGDGLQPLAWISADDLVAGILFLLAHPDITGVVNFVAPEVVSQKAFSQTLASVLNRPAFLRMPTWFVKLLFGQMGEELLLTGQAVASERLLKQQFVFKYPTLLEALRHEFNPSR